MIFKDITENKFKEDYNNLREKAVKNKITDLNLLSDYELFILIIAKTLNFGRNFKGSVKNSLIHLEDRKTAIKLFMELENLKYGRINTRRKGNLNNRI